MFTGREDHAISFTDGGELTKRFRDNNPGVRKGGYISRDAIQLLLNQAGCVGIRIYYAYDRDKQMEMVIVGVTSNENDMVGTGFLCMDETIPCPDRCGENNILNSDS